MKKRGRAREKNFLGVTGDGRRATGKNAQVTIFVIVGFVLVVGILLVFLLRDSGVESSIRKNPEFFVEKCVGEAVEESVERILVGGGEVVPSQTIKYNGSEWNYLCYQADNYRPCYNLHPMLEEQIEREIVDDTEDLVENCFDSLRKDFERRGYDVSWGGTDYSIDLVFGNVKINLEKRIDIVDGEESLSFENFDDEISSPIYGLVQTAREIVNLEAGSCNFDYNVYMLLYPEWNILRFDYFGSKIYRVIDRASGAEFRFATRSCAMEEAR